MAKPSKQGSNTLRLQDFSVSGVRGGTFPNAAGRGQRVSEYWSAVEADLKKQKQARAKLSGKTGLGKISSKPKPMKPIPPGQS